MTFEYLIFSAMFGGFLIGAALHHIIFKKVETPLLILVFLMLVFYCILFVAIISPSESIVLKDNWKLAFEPFGRLLEINFSLLREDPNLDAIIKFLANIQKDVLQPLFTLPFFKDLFVTVQQNINPEGLDVKAYVTIFSASFLLVSTIFYVNVCKNYKTNFILFVLYSPSIIIFAIILLEGRTFNNIFVGSFGLLLSIFLVLYFILTSLNIKGTPIKIVALLDMFLLSLLYLLENPLY
jgi:hypothetical protein